LTTFPLWLSSTRKIATIGWRRTCRS